ncbi:MAG TPA: outer membrane lipoprotein-sorting protein [Rectinemataceae bacterium]|nr:outer membrane lipoprotein-sorting protein [Rectinemataceae bacterium]
MTLSLPTLSRMAALGATLCLMTLPLRATPSADELLAAVDARLFLESYVSRVTMETLEPGSPPRSMTFLGQSRKDRGTYLEIVEPARTRGTRFLQLDGSLWMFNPKAGSANALRLSSRDSFQGSTFSNADVGKSQFSDDYSPSLAPDALLDHPEYGKVECYAIVATAKTETAAYGKIVIYIRKLDSMPLRMEYYAKSGLLFKKMTLSKIRDFGGFVRPSVMTMESLDKAGTVTTLTMEALEKKNVPISVFNKNYLTR